MMTRGQILFGVLLGLIIIGLSFRLPYYLFHQDIQHKVLYVIGLGGFVIAILNLKRMKF